MRAFPLSRNNSTVNGGDVRGPQWDHWWEKAQWSKAWIDTRSDGSQYLHVPCPDETAWDGAVYRVRCKSNERATVARQRPQPGLGASEWAWVYPERRKK
jgi:hypothetical protein